MKRILFLLIILVSFGIIDSALAHPRTVSTLPSTHISEVIEDSKTFFEKYFIISLIAAIVVTMTITVLVVYREELIKQVVR